MKKKLFVLALCALALTGCGKTIPKLENGEEAIVSFKDESMISVDDIWTDLKEAYGLSTILNKIDLKILKDKYADKLEDMEKSITATETSIKESYVDDDGNYDEDSLLQTLSYYGYSSLDAYLDTQRISYLTDIAKEDYEKTLITDKEVKNYYKNNIVGDISAVHILVTPASSSDEDLETAKTKAKEIIDAIKADVKSGTDILEAFKKYENDDTVTYQDLGSFNKGDMVSEFETAAYALKVNEYTTSPVKTTYGYHIILKTGESEKASLEDSEDEIRTTLAEEVIDNNSTVANSILETKAMMQLREDYGVKFNDSDIEERYNKYMNYLLNQSEDE